MTGNSGDCDQSKNCAVNTQSCTYIKYVAFDRLLMVNISKITGHSLVFCVNNFLNRNPRDLLWSTRVKYSGVQKQSI